MALEVERLALQHQVNSKASELAERQLMHDKAVGDLLDANTSLQEEVERLTEQNLILLEEVRSLRRQLES